MVIDTPDPTISSLCGSALDVNPRPSLDMNFPTTLSSSLFYVGVEMSFISFLETECHSLYCLFLFRA